MLIKIKYNKRQAGPAMTERTWGESPELMVETLPWACRQPSALRSCLLLHRHTLRIKAEKITILYELSAP
jgi:hypothetical protein